MKPVLESSQLRVCLHAFGPDESIRATAKIPQLTGYCASLLKTDSYHPPERSHSEISTLKASLPLFRLKAKPVIEVPVMELKKDGSKTLSKQKSFNSRCQSLESREREYMRSVDAFSLFGLRGLAPKDAIRQALIRRTGSLQNAHYIFDTNRSGDVSCNELTQGLKRLGIDSEQMLGKSAVDIFEIFDTNNNKSLSLAEIVGFDDFEDYIYYQHPHWLLPTSVMWSRYIKRCFSEICSLNRPPAWDTVAMIKTHGEGPTERNRMIFKQKCTDLKKQLNDKSETIRHACIQTLKKLLRITDQSDPLRTIAEHADSIQRQKVTASNIEGKIKELATIRNSLKSDVVVLQDCFKRAVNDSALSRQEWLTNLFTKASQGSNMDRNKFVVLVSNVIGSGQIPNDQMEFWWRDFAKSGADLDACIKWYKRFIM